MKRRCRVCHVMACGWVRWKVALSRAFVHNSCNCLDTGKWLGSQSIMITWNWVSVWIMGGIVMKDAWLLSPNCIRCADYSVYWLEIRFLDRNVEKWRWNIKVEKGNGKKGEWESERNKEIVREGVRGRGGFQRGRWANVIDVHKL